MLMSSTQPTSRRKAVWGPKRTIAAVALILFGLVPNATTQGQGQHRQGRKAQDGGPNSNGQDYRIDKELTSRAENRSGNHKSQVIVELQPGEKLPPQLAMYA